MTGQKVYINLMTFLCTYWLLYFVFGIVMVSIGDQLEQFDLGNSSYVITGLNIVGILLIVYGIYIMFIQNKTEDKADTDTVSNELHWYKYMTLAIIIMLSNLPFAYPYFGVISEIVRQELNRWESFAYIWVYSCAFILPYLVFAWAFQRYGQRAKIAVERMIQVLTGKYILGSILVILGGYLVFFV